MARWKFPASLVAGVWFHHHPAAAEPHHKLASCVYLGNMVAYVMGDGNGRNPLPLRARRFARRGLRMVPALVGPNGLLRGQR